MDGWWFICHGRRWFVVALEDEWIAVIEGDGEIACVGRTAYHAVIDAAHILDDVTNGWDPLETEERYAFVREAVLDCARSMPRRPESP